LAASDLSTAASFARAEHLELFKADPVRYTPQFAGFCALAREEIDEGNQ
jgi:hypothetical protein